ncbi:MAG: hypothetical protein AMXMBFR84_03540 [Candidatus Hydrogenedentota bacterium]
MSDNAIADAFLESCVRRLKNDKILGEKAIAQLSDEELLWQPDAESNSIAIIIQHMHGNMISRWTNFLTTDGEKPSRNRDREFDLYDNLNRTDLIQLWEEGWACVVDAVQALNSGDLLKTITIREQEFGVIDAIHRQLTHYAYHVGQIVYIAKHHRGAAWETLSIAKGKSAEFKPGKKD